MKKLFILMTLVLTSNLFACPNTHKEFPDGMNMDRLTKITAPIFLILNNTITFPVFEDELVLFDDPNDDYEKLIVKSKNGPQDHEQLFIPHKLRPITEFNYNEVSTENFSLEFSDYSNKKYGDFKLDTQGLISFCYEAKAPIEYRN